MYKINKPFLGTEPSSITRLADGACIPMDESNTDYQAYLKWCEEGNAPEPFEGAE